SPSASTSVRGGRPDRLPRRRRHSRVPHRRQDRWFRDRQPAAAPARRPARRRRNPVAVARADRRDADQPARGEDAADPKWSCARSRRAALIASGPRRDTAVSDTALERKGVSSVENALAAIRQRVAMDRSEAAIAARIVYAAVAAYAVLFALAATFHYLV